MKRIKTIICMILILTLVIAVGTQTAYAAPIVKVIGAKATTMTATKTSTTITFKTTGTTKVRVKIMDSKGKAVKTLAVKTAKKGKLVKYTWNGKRANGKYVTAGTYKAQIIINGKAVKTVKFKVKKETVVTPDPNDVYSPPAPGPIIQPDYTSTPAHPTYTPPAPKNYAPNGHRHNWVAMYLDLPAGEDHIEVLRTTDGTLFDYEHAHEVEDYIFEHSDTNWNWGNVIVTVYAPPRSHYMYHICTTCNLTADMWPSNSRYTGAVYLPDGTCVRGKLAPGQKALMPGQTGNEKLCWAPLLPGEDMNGRRCPHINGCPYGATYYNP